MLVARAIRRISPSQSYCHSNSYLNIHETHTMAASSIPYTLPLPGGIPDSHRPHTERTTTILVPKANTAFLNPVQEYNRDLSVSVIRAWNEQRKQELEVKWRAKLAKGKGKKRQPRSVTEVENGGDKVVEAETKAEAEAETLADTNINDNAQVNVEQVQEVSVNEEQPTAGPSKERKFHAPKITILEALSATGLRSIRYAKEIPDVKVVLANDLSPSACEAMRTNVALNGVGQRAPRGTEVTKSDDFDTEAEVNPVDEVDLGRREGCTGYVHVNEGDACSLMYAHRTPSTRVDVVDLDPYGTAAPFIDAAIGSIADGGLLCVTCTDLAVLAGSNYPEKCFSNYGGVCVTAEYSHEVALRLVLNSLAQAAARYGRYITPLISLSIDFYVRLFVRVDTKPIEVKRLASQTGVVYACSFCQSPTIQPFGRILQRNESSPVYRAATGPATNAHCTECGSAQHVAGPMWLGPIHDPAFVGRVLDSIADDKDKYGTWTRMHGMLIIAHEELPDPFYFTCNKVNGFAHAPAAPTKQVISALLNGGYKVSRSHAQSGSIKTNAPRSFIFDIVRETIKTNPVRLDKVSETSPTRALVLKPMTHEVNLTPHPDVKKFEKADKVVYYQQNPLPNWGPGARARSVKVNPIAADAGEKRKAEDETADAESKRAKVDGEEEALNI